MVLKRIAEDRKTLQEKNHTSSATDKSPPSCEGQKLGGKIQTNADDNCILMVRPRIFTAKCLSGWVNSNHRFTFKYDLFCVLLQIRLPCGESMRERFSADAPLSSVVEHISGRHPSLPSFSLLQSFPRKRFGEAELACSLRSLGLTPNAALCIQTTPPETPQDPPSPADPPPAAPNEPPPCIFPQPQVPVPEEAEALDPALVHRLPNDLWEEAVNYAGIPRAAPSMQYSSSLAGLTPELAELLLNHISKVRLLRPRTLELFFGCQLQKFVLNCYPYSTNELLRQLRAFTALKHLSLVKDISALALLSSLQTLNLDGTGVTEASLENISTHPTLTSLSLGGISVKDGNHTLQIISGLSSLRGLQELQELCLDRTAVTSRGVAELITCLPHLQVNLDGTGVSLTGIANLLSLSNIGSIRASNTRTIPLDDVSDGD
ncbi:hypothetical protein XENOCAPTIV_001221 [Xenoophorus captivus]|uniref:UBX domain-containing protein n=1 Tax=Xenoophorus captivus TaxID=1517983 RepID=A0ABV0QFS4_9TELE